MPEVLLFLNATLPDTSIIVHTKILDTLEEKAVHFISVSLLPEIQSIKADVFISTFAL